MSNVSYIGSFKIANSSLPGFDFVTGWAARGDGRRLRFRTEARKAKLQEMAKNLWENYIKEAQAKPRDALIELQKAAASMQVYYLFLIWMPCLGQAVKNLFHVCFF